MTQPRTFRIEHRFLGRLCGVCWDLMVTAVSLLLIPIGCLMLSAAMLKVSVAMMLLTIPLVIVALFSLAFGVVWNFRRHL